MASHTNLNVNVAHHGDRYHHIVVARVESLCLGVEACIRVVVHPLQIRHWVFPEKPGTSAVEQTVGSELGLLAPDPVPDSARLHGRHPRVGLRS